MLHIPKPCNEDWNKMTQTLQGAFCGSCQKEVIDFTTMTDDEVLHFLQKNTGKNLCGRATKTQLTRLKIEINENVLYTNISTWKKYLAILLICFGSMFLSCNNKQNDNTSAKIIEGKIKIGKTNIIVDTIKKDTILTTINNRPSPRPPVGQLRMPNIIEVVNPETYITGDIAPVQEPEILMGVPDFLPIDKIFS
jgi:hypothetical protein